MAIRYISIAKELTIEMRLMQQSGISKLPSEAELCGKYGCSRQTIRSALSVLEQKGHIVKKRGSGSYIANLSENFSSEIAVIVPDRNEYIFPEIIRDLQKTFSEKGYSIRCYNTDGLFLNERRILRQLLEKPPAGIIIEAQNNSLPCHNEDLLKKLEKNDMPVVYLHCAYDYPLSAARVTQDNYGGAYSLVEHLAAKGHKRIAGIMKCNDTRGVERYGGCVQASLDLGLDFREDNYFWFSSEDRRLMLDNNDTPLRNFIKYYLGSCTAVICYNDEIAYHLIQVLSTAGIDVPNKVAVVSFDNSYYSEIGDVKITSLGHPAHAAGETAARSLMSLIAGKQVGSIHLPWIITERSSD